MSELLKELASEQACGRYSQQAHKIDNMRNNIRLNRKGTIQLTDIAQDPLRLQKRADRENTLSRKDAFERINGVANFQDVCIVKKIMRMSDSVCRIAIPSNFGGTKFGTGFLVSENIIITNHHVFPTTAEAAVARAEFHYELDEHGIPSKTASFALRPDLFFMTSDVVKQPGIAFSGLDFTLVAVDTTSAEGKPISDLSSISLDGSVGKILEGENCIVIQHPAGDFKKVVLKDIRLITFTDDFLVYESDTLPGSSGSMVVGLGTGEVVGLHHSGVPRKNANGEWLRKDGTVATDNDKDDVIDWIGNEGIRISSIVKAIATLPLDDNMETYRKQLLSGIAAGPQNETIDNSKNTKIMPNEMQVVPAADPQSTAGLQYFEVIISHQPLMRQSWVQSRTDLIPGLKTSERVFPLSTDEELSRHYYISVQSATQPWALAAQIEALPQVESCIPDLPVATHADPISVNERANESAIFAPKKRTSETGWTLIPSGRMATGTKPPSAKTLIMCASGTGKR